MISIVNEATNTIDKLFNDLTRNRCTQSCNRPMTGHGCIQDSNRNHSPMKTWQKLILNIPTVFSCLLFTNSHNYLMPKIEYVYKVWFSITFHKINPHQTYQRKGAFLKCDILIINTLVTEHHCCFGRKLLQ